MTSVVKKSKLVHVHCYFIPNNLLSLKRDHYTESV